jgi:hypothetical protein
MPTRPRLSENQRCIVQTRRETDTHVRRYFGVVREVLPKGYMVQLDGWAVAQKWSENKVKPEWKQPPRAPAPKLDPQHQRPSVVAAVRRVVAPIVKPEPPEKCEAWLKYVRTLPCCNCGRGPELAPIEAHHEGKKGVAQKVRGTLAVPLCGFCHFLLTQKNELPIPPMLSPLVRRTREESLRILQAEQDRLLTAALEKLEQPARIEVLSKAMARVGGVR